MARVAVHLGVSPGQGISRFRIVIERQTRLGLFPIRRSVAAFALLKLGAFAFVRVRMAGYASGRSA